MTQDWQDSSKTSRGFKSFCTCFEKSNDCSIKWVKDPAAWGAQFKNKKIGGAFGVVHDVYQGKELVKTELRWFISDNKVEACEIPMEKLLSENKKKELAAGGSNTAPATDGDFVNIPDSIDDELPFR